MGMAMTELENVKTEPKLLSKLRNSADARLTSQELFEQRVSFVFAGIDSESDITREQIRQMLREEAGMTGDLARTNGD